MGKIIWIFITMVFFPLSLFAEQKADVDFYAELVPHKEQLYSGDSCLVSIVLYANQPFHRIKSKCSPLIVKGGRARLISENTTQQERVRTSKGMYYQLILQQYVVGGDKIGKIIFPKHRYEVELGMYEVQREPFSFFFGERQKLVKTIPVSATLSSSPLQVLPRPKRSTKDMIQSGGRVI